MDLCQMTLVRNVEGVKFFVENNTHDKSNEEFYTLSLLIAVSNGSLDIVKILAMTGVDITSDKNHASELAAEYGYLDILKYLFEHGSDVTDNSNAALKSAVAKCHLDIVKYLIENGADVNDNNMPLMSAIKSENYDTFDMVKLLIDNGAKVTLEMIHLAEDLHLYDLQDYLTNNLID